MRRPAAGLLLAALLICCLLCGCASSALSDLPGGAILAKEGGPTLTFTATDKATLYLRDQPADSIIYQGPIDKGQRLELDARTNRITLDSRQVSTAPLRPDATYQIYLKSAEKREYRPMLNP